MFKQEAELKMRELSTASINRLCYVEDTINHLLTYFGVSKQSAKIKLVELGYEEATGTLNYVEGQYVLPYIWKKGAIASNQTYSIGLVDATIQMFINRIFNEVQLYIFMLKLIFV
ncbi:hypothetical protein [Ligilactobacillus acidipiscis]|nr:hypothetical protein [Ligilactobacillus acidipiscis]